MFLLSPAQYLKSLMVKMARLAKSCFPSVYVARWGAERSLSKPINRTHFTVLAELYLRGGTLLRSNFARTNQTSIAALTSMGYLSSYLPSTGQFTNELRVTSTGAIALEKFYA